MKRSMLVLLVAASVMALLWAARSEPPSSRGADVAHKTAGGATDAKPKKSKRAPVLTGRVVRSAAGRDVGIVDALITVACGEAAGREAAAEVASPSRGPGGPAELSPPPPAPAPPTTTDEEPPPDPRFRTVTRRDGTFSFTRLPTGLCVVSASANRHVSGGPEPEAHVRVRIAAHGQAEDVLLRLYPTTEVSGVVKARGTGVSGARLSLLYQESPATAEPFGVEVDAVTDAFGHFTIEGVGPGRLRVLAEDAELGTAESGEVDTDGGTTIEDVAIDLTASGSLAGRVSDERGSPVRGATIRLVVPGEEEPRQLMSDASGAFRVDDLPPGPVRAAAEAVGFSDGAPVDVAIVADRDVAVQLTLAPRPGFGGRVVGPAGEPAAGAMVIGRDDNGVEIAATTSDEFGRFWFEPPAPGTEGDVELIPSVHPIADVSARHESFTPSKLIAVRGDERDLVLRLELGARVVGVLLDGAGRPVSSYSIDLVRIGSYTEGAGGGHVEAPTGAFALDGIEGGRYRAVLSRDDGSQRLETKAFAVTPGRISQLGTLRLEAIGSLTGSVVDERGVAVVGADISLVGGVATTTDERGRFRLEHAANGGTLRVQAYEFRERLISRVSVSEGRERSVGTIRLARDSGGGAVEYTGIGTRVSLAEGGGVSLDQVFPGSPAAKAGIEDGSVVVGIDGDDATTMSIEHAIELMRGPSGTSVMLDIVGPAGGAPRKVRLTRSDVVSQ